MRNWEVRLIVLLSILTLVFAPTLGTEAAKARTSSNGETRGEEAEVVVSSPGSFTVENELVVPFSLDVRKQAPAAIQMEFTFHAGSLRLDRVISGQRLEEAAKQISFETYEDGRTTRAVVIASGLNRSSIQAGPLFSLVFERLVDESPRVKVSSIQAVDADAQTLPAMQLDTRESSPLVAWLTRTSAGRNDLLIQTGYMDAVDLYTRRIVGQGDSKRTIDTLVGSSQMGGDLMQVQLRPRALPGRLLLLAVRDGGDPHSEADVVGIQELSSGEPPPVSPAPDSGTPGRTRIQ